MVTKFEAQLAGSEFKALNGAVDPFDLLSSVHGNVESADAMMREAGVLGWNPEMVQLSGMGKSGHIYTAPENNMGIAVPEFPGGPMYFGAAHKNFPFLRPEALVPLIDAIVAHGNPLTGIQPGPVTRFFFDSQLIELEPYSAAAKAAVGEIVKIRWQLDLGNTGKNSLVIGQKGLRLWCANGCTTADTMGSVSISHTQLAPQRIEETVQHILKSGGLGLDSWIEDARRAISTRMTREVAMEKWAKLFDWKDGKEKAALTRQENQKSKLRELWSAPTQLVTYPDTAWAFFGATTEYFDHEATVNYGSGTRTEALARRIVEGSASVEAYKNRAWELALAN